MRRSGGGRLGISRDQADPHGVADQTRYIVNAQAIHNFHPMTFDGLDAQGEPLGHIFGRMSFRDKLQNFTLAGC